MATAQVIKKGAESSGGPPDHFQKWSSDFDLSNKQEGCSLLCFETFVSQVEHAISRTHITSSVPAGIEIASPA
jgi:hypothetical protein